MAAAEKASQMSLNTPENRKTTREGVNAAQTLFEASGCIFQPVSQENDFGKDAYVDLVNDRAVSPLCIAVQIKSGLSYRREDGTHFIPVGKHAVAWRDSTVPVFGVVYDPEDLQLRWVDLTGYLRDNTLSDEARIPVKREAVLTVRTLIRDLSAAASRYAVSEAPIALKLLSENAEMQRNAVYDIWALGRHDARYLLLLRRLLIELDKRSTRLTIGILSHATAHPDIFWNADNWIPQSVKARIQPSFRWSSREVVHMLHAIDHDEWGRGSIRQSMQMLLLQDPDALTALRGAVTDLMAAKQSDRAAQGIVMALAFTDDPRSELWTFTELFPTLADNDWLNELKLVLAENNQFDLD